jgi:hypothetical protein
MAIKTVKEIYEMWAGVLSDPTNIAKIDAFHDAVDEQEGVRLCEHCNTLMTDGIIWGDGEVVECEECKDKTTTPEEWEDAVENDEAYWTEWEEEVPPTHLTTNDKELLTRVMAIVYDDIQHALNNGQEDDDLYNKSTIFKLQLLSTKLT